ncbi:gluconate 2-dehydrogenase subunit 3 family protein [Alteromonas sp. AMM-1]|uniref:gluconate 2-dehydrogenase subunit 3 family protein n=1 Tax=Alteromonas sp. AMM-1 TaxID=3394233 RepID=UPI0039A61ED4
MQSQNPSRRTMLKRMLLGLGLCVSEGVLLNNAVAAAMSYDATTSQTGLFTPQERAVLKAICECVIPRTDTPGAVDVGCTEFVEHQLLVVFSAGTQQACKSVLQSIYQRSAIDTGKSFELLTTETQIALLEKLEAMQQPFSQEQYGPFKQLKSLIVFGYYTSMPGATQELTYQAVPGRFVGSVPYADIGSAYSSKDYY